MTHFHSVKFFKKQLISEFLLKFTFSSFNNTIISGNPQIWGYTPKLGGDTPKFGGVTPKFGGVTPKFGGDQKDKFQKFEKKFIGKIKEYYFVLFPQ